MQSFDALESIMIMAFIEFLISDREEGWIFHMQGIQRLFAMRGPKKMTSLPCVIIIEQTRPWIIFAATILRKPTILAQPEWKTEPLKLHPERIDPRKLLFDILCDCPELFALREQLDSKADETERVTFAHDVYKKARGILSELEQWGMNRAADPSNACTEIPSPPSTPTVIGYNGGLKPAWPTIFQYQSLLQCANATMYNGAIILVARFLLGLEVFLVPGHGNDHCLHERLHKAGMMICRSVEYYRSHAPRGDETVFPQVFSIRMAYDAVGRTDLVIGTWLKDVLKDFSSESRGAWKSAKTLLDIRM